ncbi:MAG: glycosyltransferase [Alphaproteobacteria bacterium]
MTGPSVFIYVQHLLGVGHLSRALTLADGLIAAGARVTLASGGFPAPGLTLPPQVSFIQLPPLRAADAGFADLRDEADRPLTATWKDRRRAALLAAYDKTEPDVLITELYPFGRRMMAFELKPLLEQTRKQQPRPLVMASVRDILATPKPERMAATVALIQRFYDLILVHSDPKIIPLDVTFPAAREIADTLRYTGYMVPEFPMTEQLPPAFTDSPPDLEVLISAGGGGVALPIIAAAAAARPFSTLKDRPWRCRIAPQELDRVRQTLGAASNDLILERPQDDFRTRLRHCVVSLSRAGYNTTMDILSAQARALVIPFAAEGETEQTIRAEVMARHRLLMYLTEDRLEPRQLAAALDAASQMPRPTVDTIDLSGRLASARLVMEAYHRHRSVRQE